MPFKLSKIERAELDKSSKQLAQEQTELVGVLEEQGAIIEAAYEKINGAVDSYNNVLADARAYLKDISSQAQFDFDKKSDTWQNGERGEAVQEWINELDNVVSEMDEIHQFQYDTPALDLPDHSDLLDNLEDEPSY